MRHVASLQDADLYHYQKFTTGVFVLESETSKSAAKLFYRLLDCAETPEGENEPMFNLFTSYEAGRFRSIIVFRSRHRSHHYFSEGPDHLTMSPGCADMGGMLIVPVPEEYESLTPELLSEMIAEVSVSREEEARILNIPIVAIVDTNCDPDEIDYVIPGNDDAIRAIKLIAATMGAAITEGRQGEQLSVSDETAPAEEAPVDTTPRAPRKRASKTAEEIAAQ